MSFFASRLTPWFAWQARAPAQKTTHAEMQILYPLLSQYLRHSVLNNVRGRYENALFRVIKISEFGKWVERHNGDHVIHVTSDDVAGDRNVAQPSRVHATKSVALATQCCSPG